MRWITFVVFAGLVVTGCTATDLYDITVGDVELEVEVVDTQETRGRGLMFRDSLPETQAMLFVFQDYEIRAFYMKNTSIPLSIAYIDDLLVIREIHDMEPFSLESIFSARPAKYALEVNQGAFTRLGISVGDRLIPSRALERRIGL